MSYVVRTFPLELLKEWDAPYTYEVWSETEDVGRRWVDVCTTVFRAPDDGFLYEITFDVGKTENQWQAWYDDFGPQVTLPRVIEGLRVVEQKYWKRVEV